MKRIALFTCLMLLLNVVVAFAAGPSKAEFDKWAKTVKLTGYTYGGVEQTDPGVFMAGQITGVEGYIESAACGLWLGMLLAARKKGVPLEAPPVETALGGLLNHLKNPAGGFQPSNIHFGLLPELGRKMRKAERKAAYAERAQESFAAWLSRLPAGWK